MTENIKIVNTTNLNIELFHIQTNISFELPLNQNLIRIGKPNDLIIPDIDITPLPSQDVVSRQHAEIRIENNNYYLVDIGSVNGTFLNDVKLEPKKPYPLKLGDKISLGKEDKVSFIFQYKQNSQQPNLVKSSPTVFQPEVAKQEQTAKVDKTSKLVGLALMVTSIIIIAANTQVGIFIRIPGVLLCIAGAVFLFQRRFDRNWGWVLIALGAAVIMFTGNVFASVNLLAIFASALLFVAGYQLTTTGKVFNYSLRSLPKLLKK